MLLFGQSKIRLQTFFLKQITKVASAKIYSYKQQEVQTYTHINSKRVTNLKN